MKHTAEEKKEWRNKIRGFAGKVKAMSQAERDALAMKIGTVTPEGHTLSPYNTCLLWMQAHKAVTMAGGFRQWQKNGRIVKKGEHSIGVIYVPMIRKAEDEDGNTEPDDVHFRLVSVFDVEQTEELQKATA